MQEKKLKITDGKDYFYIFNLDLEIKLNLCNKSDDYETLGNHIYYFFAPNYFTKPRSDILKVDTSQYKYLFNLNNKTLNDIF